MLWIGLVAIPTVLLLPETKKRIPDFRQGLKGIRFVPVNIILLFVGLIVSFYLSKSVPLLNFSWLSLLKYLPSFEIGYKPIVQTVTTNSVSTSPVESTGYNLVFGPTNPSTIQPSHGLDYYFSFIVMIVALLAIWNCNYYEEKYFRDNFKQLGVWLALHLTMGVPIFALLPIGLSGLLYKFIYGRYGIQQSYVCHFLTNSILIGLLLLYLFLQLGL